LSYVLIIELVT